MGLKDNFLKVIDSAALRAKSLVNDVSDSFEAVDFDSSIGYMLEQKNALIEKGNSFIKDLEDTFKQIKDCITDYSVTVPFDEEIGETLEYSVDGNKLTVEVKFNDETTSRTSKTVVVIPENCDVSKIKKTINKVTKTAVISVPKKVDTIKKAKKSVKKGDAKHKPALQRDEKGRFVKKA
jgi:hypothetical protein